MNGRPPLIDDGARAPAASNGGAAARAARAGDAETAGRLARLAAYCYFVAVGAIRDDCTHQPGAVDRWFAAEAGR